MRSKFARTGLMCLALAVSMPGIASAWNLGKGLEYIDEVLGFFKRTGTRHVDDVAKRIKIHPKIKNIGVVVFKDTITKGRLGERLTAKRITAMGYKKLKSKYNPIHGIDGVYIKKRGRKIEEIIVAESKVDTSMLHPGPPRQMSDDWLWDRCKRLLESGNPDAQATGKLVLETMEKNPHLIKKQLWHHDLEAGKTVVKRLDADGNPVGVDHVWEDSLIQNEIRQWCEKKKLRCLPVDSEI